MPIFDNGANGDVHLYYEARGQGFPVLLIAPGGMRSAISFWDVAPWNPIDQLSTGYRVIAMDQRNAGRSTAPIQASDSWPVYTQDQLALMDHLGLDRFHIAGMCIGGSYIMGLIQAAPERVASAVMFQPIGLDNELDNRKAFYEMFDAWADELKPHRPDVSDDAWESFKNNMYGSDFLFSASHDVVSRCETPLLVLLGNDQYHPSSISREVAALAPNATLVESWRPTEDQPAAREAVEQFLAKHTPGP